MNIRKTISDRPWILAVVVTVLVVAWLTSGSLSRDRNSNGNGTADVGSIDVVPRVQVREQNARLITRIISVYGRSAPARSADIKAETDGRVEKIAARRGQQLKKGDLILRLDLRDRLARLTQARASVKEFETSYQAQLKLKGEGYVSDTQLAETLAKLESARAELVRAELDLKNREIRAPFDGVLVDRQVELGDFVRSGDTIASFADNTHIIVTGSVSEQDAKYVSVGAQAEARLVTGQTATGHIRYISPVADQATRTFTVELEIPNPDGTLPVGVTAEMRLPGGELMAQKVSPSLLTLDDNGRIGIKTVDQFNRVEFYPVEIARSETDGIWVTGLPETARVIIVGQGYVDTGAEVEPVFADQETALAAETTK